MRDLNSTNGTYLEGVRLYEAEVPLNTVLQVGETEVRFEPRRREAEPACFHGMVGTDAAVRQVVELVKRVAPANVLVTVQGESGTGKELVAKALHASSPRAGKPFIALNCATLPGALVESELFGHEKGAFTGADTRRKGAFEEADGGTLFLDEVGELPLEQHDWPGNIRELRNVVNRALLLRRGPQLEEADITFAESTSRRVPEDAGTAPLELPAGVTLEQMMERVERQLIESTLRRCHYHKDRAAKELGLARSTLFKKLKQWDPDPEGD